MEPHDLGHYSPEFEPLLPGRRFAPCTHDHEPGCAVKEALGDEVVALSRYQSYLSMLEGLRDEAADVGAVALILESTSPPLLIVILSLARKIP